MRFEEIISLALPLGIVSGLLLRIFETKSWVWPMVAGFLIVTVMWQVDNIVTKYRKKQKEKQG